MVYKNETLDTLYEELEYLNGFRETIGADRLDKIKELIDDEYVDGEISRC